MAKYPHLTRHGKQGTLRFRRAVPFKLRPIIGRTEIVVSLKSADLGQALPLYHQVSAKTQQRFDEATGQSTACDAGNSATSAHLSSVSIEHDRAVQSGDLASVEADHYAQCVTDERAHRESITAAAFFDEHSFRQGHIVDLPNAVQHDIRQRAFRSASVINKSPIQPLSTNEILSRSFREWLRERIGTLTQLVECRNWSGLVDYFQTDQTDANVLFRMARAELQFLVETLNADPTDAANPLVRGELHQPSAQARALQCDGQVGHTSPTSEVAPLLSTVAQEWVAYHVGPSKIWSDERRDQCERIILDFIDVCDDKPFSDYVKSDGRKFRDLMQRLPANLEKRRHLLDVHERNLELIAARAEEAGWTPQTISNVNKKLAIVGQCFKWISQNYDECSANPVQGLTVKINRSANEEKDPFELRDLITIFHAPVYVGCQDERHWYKPGSTVLWNSPKFWIPLIGFFTGMRSNEICQLATDNFCEHNGLHFITLPPTMRLKTRSSVRNVPLHRELVELGLLDFVRRCKGPLFPKLPVHKTERLSDGFGKHFRRFLESLGVKRPRIDFHSFRHTFVAAARAAGMDFEARERIIGHTLKDQPGRYGNKFNDERQDMALMAVRHTELQKLRFQGVDLTHLKVRSASAAETGSTTDS